jgi:hypothetical protein
MAQIFPAGTNAIVRALVIGVPLAGCLLVGALYAVEWSPWATREWVPISQPVPFSHKHHVGQLGIDCRYCHAGVEKSAYAGLPPTETCMTCHSQLYTDQAMLAPVRESLATGQPIRWNRVHDLPDFVYFNHSIHVNKGIGCTSCHGRENQMQLTWQDQTLYMSWCLQCHRHPEKYIASRDQVFNPERVALKDEGKLDQARELVQSYGVQSSGVLTDCYTCHR